MNKSFIGLLLVIFLFSCKNKFDGKIEERYGSYYLINTSSYQSFRFTIKKTELKDSSVYNYTTELIALAPGDEKLLGKETIEEKDDFISGWSIEVFQPTEEQIKESKNRKKKNKSSIFNEENLRNDEFDTIINGRTMMYRELPKIITLPVHKIRYSFEITGQVKLNMK